MPREKKQFSNVQKWGNVTSIVRDGQKVAHLRCEPKNHFVVPDEVLAYTAKNDDHYIAYLEANGQKAILAQGKTRKGVLENLAFDVFFSRCVSLCYYRSFCQCFNHEGGNHAVNESPCETFSQDRRR